MAESHILLYIVTPALLAQVLPVLQASIPQLTTHFVNACCMIQQLALRETLNAACVEIPTEDDSHLLILRALANYAPDCPVFLLTTAAESASRVQSEALLEGQLIWGPWEPQRFAVEWPAWMTYELALTHLTEADLRAHVLHLRATLIENRRNLGTLLRNFPGMAYRCLNTPDWTMEFVSEGCWELTGYPPEALLHNQQLAYNQLIYPEDRTLVWQSVQAALRERRHFYLVYRLIHASGEIRWVWERGCGVFTETGELVALEGLIFDFTAQQRAEYQMRLQAMALEATDAGVSISDQDGIVLWINPAFTRLTGYAAEEIIGHSMEVLRADVHPPSFYDELHMHIHQGKVWRGELVSRRKDGTLYHEERTITPVANASGVITHFVTVQQDVNQRYEDLRALEESEARYRTLFEQAQDALFLEDEQDHIVDVNQRACDLMGYSRAELLALTIPDLQAPAYRRPVGTAVQAELLQHQHHPFESVNLHKDGTSIPVEITNTRFQYAGQALILSSVRDISERKRAEALLAREKERLELLHRLSEHLSSSLDMYNIAHMALQELSTALEAREGTLFVVDTTISPPLEVIASAYGESMPLVEAETPQRRAVGVGMAGWVAAERHPVLVADVTADPRWATFFAQDAWIRGVLSVPLIGGDVLIGVLSLYSAEVAHFNAEHLHLAEAAAAPIAVALNNARLFKTLNEYSEQLEQRVTERTAELQAQYARLDAILRSITDGVIVADGEGNMIQLNPVAQQWLQQSLTPEDALRLQKTVQELSPVAASRPERVLELQGVDLELRAAPIQEFTATEVLKPFPWQASVVIAVHDVSHLKALDRMRTQFVSDVSHELRTPTATIQAYVQLLRRCSPEKVPEYLEALEKEVRHQGQLIDDILQLSRLDAGQMALQCRVLNLNTLVETHTLGYQLLAQQRALTLQVQVAAQPLRAYVDEVRIRQVLNNLIMNALQYTPSPGQVTVTVTKAYLKGRHTAAIEVRDTGIGIPPEELPHVFERFFRGSHPREQHISGTGLGLAIVQEIVTLHGGWITLESTVGIGTTVTVYLPLYPAQT